MPATLMRYNMTILCNPQLTMFRSFAEHGPQTRDGTFKERKSGSPRPPFEVHERDLERARRFHTLNYTPTWTHVLRNTRNSRFSNDDHSNSNKITRDDQFNRLSYLFFFFVFFFQSRSVRRPSTDTEVPAGRPKTCVQTRVTFYYII